jgi:hypothetical protein
MGLGAAISRPPQFGYIFPVGNMQGYLNLKAYGGIRPGESSSGLEHVADVRDFAGGRHRCDADPAPGYEVTDRSEKAVRSLRPQKRSLIGWRPPVMRGY